MSRARIGRKECSDWKEVGSKDISRIAGLPSFMTKCRLPTVCYCRKILTSNWQLDEKSYGRMLGTLIIHISKCIRCRIIFPSISHMPDQSCWRLIEQTKIRCSEFASYRTSITSFWSSSLPTYANATVDTFDSFWIRSYWFSAGCKLGSMNFRSFNQSAAWLVGHMTNRRKYNLASYTFGNMNNRRSEHSSIRFFVELPIRS